MQAAKLMARDAGRTQFFHQCPRQYETLMRMIDELVFEDSPKYSEFVDILMDVSISSDAYAHTVYCITDKIPL